MTLSLFKESMGGGSSAVTPEETLQNECESARSSRWKTNSGCCYCFLNRKNRSSEKDNEETLLKEEAKAWSNDFERLLKHSVGQKLFQEFLQGQFSDENLRFWIEAESYSSLMDSSERRKRAKILYDDYVSTISPCEVSLDAQHRQQIETNLPDAPKELFKQAQDYIYKLMYRDCFPRFLKSRSYKGLCRRSLRGTSHPTSCRPN